MAEKEITEGDLPEFPERSDPADPGSAKPVTALADLDLTAVYFVALRVTHDSHAAEDISQNVYLRLMRLPPDKLASIGCLQKVAQKAARNLAINWQRDRRARDAPLESLDNPLLYEAEDPTFRLNDREDATRLLAQLPEDQQIVFVLQQYRGYTADQIAELVGTTANAVQKKIARARKRLKRRLNDEPLQHKSRISRFFKEGKEQK